MKDMPSLTRSCSPSQTPTYPKAVPIPDPRQPPTKHHIYQTITLPNQQYESAPCELLLIHINSIASIRKHYATKAATRNKPIHPNDHSLCLFEITVRSFSSYNVSSRIITLRKLPAECIVQTCLKNEYSRQPYRIDWPKPTGSDTGLSCQEPRTLDNGQHDQTLRPP